MGEGPYPVRPADVERMLRELGLSRVEAKRALALGLLGDLALYVSISAVERALVFDLGLSAAQARAVIARGLNALRSAPRVGAGARTELSVTERRWDAAAPGPRVGRRVGRSPATGRDAVGRCERDPVRNAQ